jgi:hypothetical protein
VSANKRFLVHEDGTPFFYLGDTAWELFHRLNREEADSYLRNRAEKGFTVIQAVILAELNGLVEPNPYGQVPLLNRDPATPNEDYFKHVDWIVGRAEELGLRIGMLPTWGSHWHTRSDSGGEPGPATFNVNNARVFGRYLGHRFKDKPIIWILGGDRMVENASQQAVIRAIAHGLKEGDLGSHLITFHPPGGRGSSEWFHHDEWLDFNMRQNGHTDHFSQYATTNALSFHESQMALFWSAHLYQPACRVGACAGTLRPVMSTAAMRCSMPRLEPRFRSGWTASRGRG